ncbi:MAG: hypothetical protein R3Y23_04940 [Bacillota bacterium]
MTKEIVVTANERHGGYGIMKKKAFGIFIVAIMVVLSLGVVISDDSSAVVSSNITNVQSTEAVQLSTSVDDLDIPDTLTRKPLDALTIWYPANYYLSQDWIGSSALVGSINILSGNNGTVHTVYLDLCGHSISVASGSPVIKVSSGYLVVYDSVGGGCIIGANSSYSLGGGGVYVSANGDFRLYDGATITGNTTQSSSCLGGGVCNDGTFYMYGGTISDNSCGGSGGGVYNNGTF